MSTTIRKSVSNTAGVVGRSQKSRRLSSASSNDVDLPPRPTKRAKTTKKEATPEESQTTLVANAVADMGIESQDTAVNDASEMTKPPKGGRKKKAAQEPTPADYPPRISREWKVGAHISAAGGIENAILNAAKIGAESFALFLKSQRQWAAKDLTSTSINGFKSRMETFGYDMKHVLPHGSYLVNLGNPDKEKRDKSYECFLDDLKRCEQVGIGLYNFHPGSTVKQCTPEQSISYIAECLNKAHKATKFVVTVLENMASPNVIGGSLEQLAQIIAEVEDKTRVGVCLDTCHLFASGYDIRTRETYDATMAEFEEKVGFKYLKGLHLNDSKAAFNSKRDLHQHLGMGHIGLRAFGFLMRDDRMKGLPMVLETETEEVWPKEVEILQRMADPATPEDQFDFEAMAEEIKVEVKKYAKEKPEKPKKEAAPKKGKGKKAKKAESEAESDEED
ncbi:hypothetical protein M408DRAFT_333026 [Serendipita vermifera MAFF 305830]|uniref:Apurinic-apyrimidinic endonuclease 1 n=1 Tax=Serendipita vermifera MAFF 305830 TaxID=933852 RepID=A0A0C3AC27_SERVB|nr:hypothetical protein M408DRAFT_333026 [Serendipita vermifera MAFF 305830]